MARKKKFTETSALRHKVAMERIFSAGVSEETAREVANAVNNAWIRAFGAIHKDYMRLKEYLGKAHPEVPAGLYGLYRSFLLKAQKEIPTGRNPEELIDEFSRKCGLDPVVLRDILEHFSPSYEKPTEEAEVAK